MQHQSKRRGTKPHSTFAQGEAVRNDNPPSADDALGSVQASMPLADGHSAHLKFESMPDFNSVAAGGDTILTLAPVQTDVTPDDQETKLVAAPPAQNVVGNLDHISDTIISGWVMIRDAPSHRCKIFLMEEGQILKRTVASHFREDLKAAGIGDGCYGYQVEMPRGLLDGNIHHIAIVECSTGQVVGAEIEWQSTAGTATQEMKDRPSTDRNEIVAEDTRTLNEWSVSATSNVIQNKFRNSRLANSNESRILVLFDVSDLVYYLGHHPNLTGIQRVQSSIILATALDGILPISAMTFLSFNSQTRRWMSIPAGFLIDLLQDMFLPEGRRSISFAPQDARVGMLPGAKDFVGTAVFASSVPSVLCMLGAAWVQQDYFHRVLALKRQFGTKFVMTVHDLIPIYARDTCDQGTVRVFEGFLRRAVRHVDHYLCVSENTAIDLRRFIQGMGLSSPSVTVTRNGSSFKEFLTEASQGSLDFESMPQYFVLFVSTIEGRKNHKLMLDVWQRMVSEGIEPPQLVCVGRIGWRSENFVAKLVEENYLDGRVVILQDISDAQLQLLYQSCLFTVYPSIYEGWGLPVGEALASGKICVVSNRSSLPEVAGDLGVYINLDDPEHCYCTIRDLVIDDAGRERREAAIRSNYLPITWHEVASQVIEGCKMAVATDWVDPYPYAATPYSVEISFGRREHESIDSAIGQDLLDRIIDARTGILLLEPLREDSFLIGEDARTGSRWAEPEAWGTWLCHEWGEMLFGLDATNCTVFYIALRLRAAAPVAGCRVSISANGEAVWSGPAPHRPTTILIRVRRRGVSSSGWKLRLRADIKVPPDALQQVEAIDRRLPLLGFERMVIVPESDLKTRVDVMTALVF
jgi:glycosyltransferase involved in cell wall biosynthesis